MAIKECFQTGGSCHQGSVGHCVFTHPDHHRALCHVEWEGGTQYPAGGQQSGGVIGVQWILQTSSSLAGQGRGAEAGAGGVLFLS